MQENQNNNITQAVTKLTQSVADLSTTVDDLAAMTARGFDKMQGKLKILEKKNDQRPTLEQIELKFQNFEKRLTENIGDKPMERDRVLNTKTDTVASKLGDKSIFSSDDVRHVASISPFAVNPLNQ